MADNPLDKLDQDQLEEEIRSERFTGRRKKTQGNPYLGNKMLIALMTIVLDISISAAELIFLRTFIRSVHK